MKAKIMRGEMYYADLNPIVGSEQGGVRPVLILQNNMLRLNLRRFILNSQLEALAESLTRDFRFLAEKCGRSDRKKTRLQVALRLVG